MSVFVKSALTEISVRNKEIRCLFYPTTGRYTIVSPQGEFNNIFPLIFVECGSISILEEPTSKNGPEWDYAKKHKGLTPFFPQPIPAEEFSEDIVQLEEFSDQIDQGLVAKIPLRFESAFCTGVISAYLCIKLYDGLRDAKFTTIYLQIDKWDGFKHTPQVHSLVPLAGDMFSSWIQYDEKHFNPKDITFFHNGYQSWSPNSLAGYKDKIKVSPIKIGQIIFENNDTMIKCQYFSEMFTAITDKQSGKSVILGFTTHERQFNRIFMDRMRTKGKMNCILAVSQVDGIPITLLKPNHVKSEEFLIFFTDKSKGVQGLSKWAEITGKRMKSLVYNPPENPRFEGSLAGYCSWYYYYTKVTERDMVKNLDFFMQNKGYPINLIQLDDGYQSEVGDFTSINKKFPTGMRALVDTIHERGYLAGLWIAPFFAQDRSELFKNHPEWFLRDEDGKLILAGVNWGSKVYALDISKHEVIEYVKKLIQTIVEDWNYDYIKIDFVYSSEIIGSQYYLPGVTRAEVYRNGIEFIRDQMGDDRILLGCGAPLGPSIGVVDAMRIGADTAAKWRAMGKIGDLAHYKLNVGLPSLKPALQATILRSFMHNKFWMNDPDCVVVRKKKSKLNLDEIRFQLTVMGLSAGMIMFSDDLTLLEKDRLRYMKMLLPPYKEGAVSLDMLQQRDPELFGMYTEAPIGKRILLALLNWKDRSKPIRFTIRDILNSLNVTLDATEFYIYDFWKKHMLPGEFSLDEHLTVSNVPKHGCTYYSIIPIEPNNKSPIIISSDLHITQGCQEIKNVEFFPEENKMVFTFDLRFHDGTITLFSKTKLKPQVISGRNFEVKKLKDIGYLLTIPVFFPIDNILTLYFD